MSDNDGVRVVDWLTLDRLRVAAQQSFLTKQDQEGREEAKRVALARLERGLAEARAIIDRGPQRIAEGVYLDPYPGAFGYLEATVASYLEEAEHA
jgi:hypothetical protein